MLLEKHGYEVETAGSGEEAIQLIESDRRFAVVLTDLKMDELTGLELLQSIKEHDPSCQVVVMTAYGSPESAKKAIQYGAYDYIEKPFNNDDIRMLVERAVEKHELKSENLYLRKTLREREHYGDLIGQSDKMQDVYELIDRVAQTDTTILIQGESGTGKELVARAIHDHSDFADGSFVPINCGAIPENLIESELFGHLEGSFTNAESDKEGLLQSASGGSAFLDEIGELSENVQVKLLRVLQQEEVKPVGSTETEQLDCRILAATNKNLREEVEKGEFREDLFYRLNIIPIELPPLRRRKEDIEPLVEHFIEKYNAKHDRDIEGVNSEAMKLLLQYNYPGNVRELENIIERAATLTKEVMIDVDVLPYYLQEESFSQFTEDIEIPEEGFDLESMVEKLEKNVVSKALDKADGVKKDAAELLGISFRSLRYRLDKYDMD
jgi:two-component system response regulator PilR (NtrC family)